MICGAIWSLPFPKILVVLLSVSFFMLTYFSLSFPTFTFWTWVPITGLFLHWNSASYPWLHTFPDHFESSTLSYLLLLSIHISLFYSLSLTYFSRYLSMPDLREFRHLFCSQFCGSGVWEGLGWMGRPDPRDPSWGGWSGGSIVLLFFPF